MTRYRFGGHEGFPPRSPWPIKGIDALKDDPEVFSRENATVRFGVGKNMVASIRFWSLQFGLAIPGKQRGTFVPTDLGDALFDRDKGHDPYLEFPETLWILHHELCSRLEPSSIFRLVFGYYNQPVFTRDSLLKWLIENALRIDPTFRASEVTVARDIDILIRTYRPQRLLGGNRAEDDSLDSPLADLGLINEVEPGQYKIQRQSASVPNPLIIERALIEYWRNEHPSEKVLSFDTIQYREGSPGRILCISPSNLAESLEAISRHGSAFYFDETAGMRSIHIRSHEILQRTDDIDSLELMYKRGML